MGIGDIADGLVRQIEAVGDGVSEALFEPVIRLGVTGLARAGKTVFITSLVANLLDRERMAQLGAGNRIRAAFLQPQPDDTVPRFDYEAHIDALTGPTPHWPESTRAVSQLRLSFRVQPSGLLGGVSGLRTVHLDIVDYPGEWLLDLALLEQSYRDWSHQALAKAEAREEAGDYLKLAGATDGAAALNEETARGLAAAYTAYQHSARAAGYSDCGPGRFLLPGELEGSPVLTFAPLAPPDRVPRASLWREMERRYEVYRRAVVRPFFRDHFARINRQIVLVDLLDALHGGPPALEDLRATMAQVLGAFRPGRNSWLGAILMGRRVDRILFAATKADHLHHTQHPKLQALMDALLREARDRAEFSGAQVQALAIAALRATVEDTRMVDGRELNCVRGILASSGKQAAFFPGTLPDDPNEVLGPARTGAKSWLEDAYGQMQFAPAPLTRRPGSGPPHIRLDKAAEFLIGDKL